MKYIGEIAFIMAILLGMDYLKGEPINVGVSLIASTIAYTLVKGLISLIK